MNLYNIIKKKIKGIFIDPPEEFKGCPCGFEGENKCKCNEPTEDVCGVCVKDTRWKEELVENRIKKNSSTINITGNGEFKGNTGGKKNTFNK